MASPTESIVYGIRQIRLLNLLATGAADGSATTYDITSPQSAAKSFVYIDGEEQEHRGGDDIVALINEDDKFIGVNFTLIFATLMNEVDGVICGGTSTPASSKWESPTIDALEAYPFSMIIWVANYVKSDRSSVQDGFIKYTMPFCKGKRTTDINADKTFGKPAYAIEARNNESNSADILSAYTYEKVDAIT